MSLPTGDERLNRHVANVNVMGSSARPRRVVRLVVCGMSALLLPVLYAIGGCDDSASHADATHRHAPAGGFDLELRQDAVHLLRQLDTVTVA